MRLNSLLVTILLITANNMLSAQSENALLVDADQKYEQADYASAETSYRKARLKNSSLEANNNLGNATYEQERFEEAIEFYLSASKKTDDKTISSDIMYNIGNAYFGAQDLEMAIDYYKQAIRLDQGNKEAKYNLAVAKEIKKQMQQQQQDQQQDQEQSDQENQDQEQEDSENQDQDSQEQNEEEGEEQKEQEQDSTQQAQEAQFDSTRLQKQNLDSLDAMKLLQIIQNEEQKVQEMMRKYNSNRKKPTKDW